MKSEKQSSYSHARGAAILIAGAILSLMFTSSALASGPLEKVIYAFQGGSDGQFPAGGVIADKNGNLYGATAGSFGAGCPTGCGTVFELSPPTTTGGTWSKTEVYVFKGGNDDGAEPTGALVFDKAGNLYGATSLGSSSNGGTVFELSPPTTPGGSWSETILAIFPADGSGGLNPMGSLIFDAEGNIYGVTGYGGSSCGCGTVFELSPPPTAGGLWTETVLHKFGADPNDGAYPNEGLMFDHSGALYGTTWGGGINTVGTAFELKRHNGIWSEKPIATFIGYQADLCHPGGGLISDAAGNVYGTALVGGYPYYGYVPPCDQSGCGGVFELSPPTMPGGSWIGTGGFAFWASGPKMGDAPTGRMVMDAAGNIYGVTASGGLNGRKNPGADGGTFFQLVPSTVAGQPWTQTTLHAFAGVSYQDGRYPNGSLIRVNGKFYGTTQVGGSGTCSYSASSPVEGCGTVYSLVMVP